MKKAYLVGSIIAMLLSSTACDSGDIRPKEVTDEQGCTLEAHFRLTNTEAFPIDYNFVFGVFAAESNTPLVSVNILRPNDGQVVTVRLENMPEEAATAKLCLLNSGRQSIYSFFEQTVDISSGNDILIPETIIDILPYDRIQKLIFQQYNCVSCHQGTSGAAELLLTEGVSYHQLANVPSTRSDKARVTPGNPEESFLLDVLTQTNSVKYPHTGLVTRSEDLTMLRIWIEKGCPQ